MEQKLLNGNQDFTARNATPASLCGVSLSWLEKFAASLVAVQLATTAELVSKVVIPTTSKIGGKTRWVCASVGVTLDGT